MLSLLDQLKNLIGTEIAALAAFGWSVAWGAAQNFFDKLSAPTVAGPGKADILRYGMDILQSGNSKEACQKAADGIYNLLLPGFGDMMAPMVSGVTNLIGTGDQIGAAAGSGPAVFNTPHSAGTTQQAGLPDILTEEGKPDEER